MKKEELAHLAGYKVLNSVLFSPSGRRMKTQNSKGYLMFTACFSGQKKGILLHRLIAYQKYGSDIYVDGVVVRHIDGNSLNNSPSNLILGSASDNMMDMPKDLRIKKALIATSHVRKYNKDEVRIFHESSPSYKATMDRFGIKGKGHLYWILHS